MKHHHVQASILFNEELKLEFNWLSYKRSYDKHMLQMLCEVYPKECVSKANKVLVDDIGNQTTIHSGVKIELNIKASLYSIYEIYYPAICQFFRVEESYASKIWNQILNKTEDGARVEVCLEMNDTTEGRDYNLEVVRFRADNVFKSYDNKKYAL